MNAKLCGLALSIAVIFVSACTTPEKGAVQSQKQMLKEAGEYFAQLKSAGDLPGIGKDDHGVIHVHSLTPDYDAAGNFTKTGAAFPVSVMVEVNTKGDTSKYPVYQYELTKADQNATWRLARAVRLDGKDEVVELVKQ